MIRVNMNKYEIIFWNFGLLELLGSGFFYKEWKYVAALIQSIVAGAQKKYPAFVEQGSD